MKSDARARTLLIGYGNPLREDDGLGVAVAKKLEGCAGVDILTAHQLLVEMAEEMAHYERVIFVDVNTTAPPGVLAVPLPESVTPALGHTLSPWRLMAYAQTLFGSDARFWIFSAGGERFDYKEGLSPAAQRAAVELSGMIWRLIASS